MCMLYGMALNSPDQLDFAFLASPASPDLQAAQSGSASAFEARSTGHAGTAGRVSGRAAMRARTAVMFSRLQNMGLRGVTTLKLVTTRSVMVSLSGGTLRVHEGYTDAPENVLRAIVACALTRNRARRLDARDIILSYEVRRPAPRKRPARPMPGDVALLTQLAAAHLELNERWFQGSLSGIPIHLSGRMASRLGHFDPGSANQTSEIVLSRSHLKRDGWREATETLLHEMIHQWQHETGRPVDHGMEFRAMARRLGITPSAKRSVRPLFPLLSTRFKKQR